MKVFYSLCMSVRDESHKLLASMSSLRYCSRMLVSTATELSSTPLTSWPGATHTRTESVSLTALRCRRVLWRLYRLTAEELLQRLVLSQHLDRQPASSRLHGVQQGALQAGREEEPCWRAGCILYIFFKNTSRKKSHADFCSAVHFSQFVRNLLLEGGGLSAELSFWLVGKTISGNFFLLCILFSWK